MKNTIIAAIVAGAAVGTAGAQEVITDYVLFGEPGNQTFTAPGTVADNVTGLNMTRGPGLNGNAGANSFNSNGWHTLSTDDYVSFGFTVDDGFHVDLDEFWFGGLSSNTGPRDLGLFYSGDGFGTALFSFTQLGAQQFTNNIVDLSALTGLTGTVEFRIYATSNVRADGNGTIGSTGTFRVTEHFDSGVFTPVQFIGTVIPAPGAVALLGLGGLVAARRRRA